MERLRRDRSILDAVGGELKGLELILGPGDQIKLDEYLDALRDIERRIQMAEQQSTRELPVVDQPVGVPSDYAEHAKLMMDLLALAYQTDLTRISSFMLAREVSGRAYPEIGVSDSHHPLSHHRDRLQPRASPGGRGKPNHPAKRGPIVHAHPHSSNGACPDRARLGYRSTS